MTGEPFVDVVTVIYREFESLSRFLQGLVDQDYPMERMRLIVVDNGSSKEARRFLQTAFLELPFESELFVADANLGFGGGSNHGAWQGNGEYILFLNPDTEPENQMLGCLVRRALSELKLGLVEAVQLPHRLDRLADPQKNYVDWCSGGVTLARREALESVGGFDKLFHPTYCEDVDLSWRMWLDGWKCAVEPDAMVRNDNNPPGGEPKPNEIFYTAKFSFAMHFIYDSIPGLLRHIGKCLRYAVSPRTDKIRRRGIFKGFGMLAFKFIPLLRRRRRIQPKLRKSPERERIVFTEWYYGRWKEE
jgi:GT2 family glycosyltransferase